jgi:hypothetical protein
MRRHAKGEGTKKYGQYTKNEYDHTPTLLTPALLRARRITHTCDPHMNRRHNNPLLLA